jgi:hypothetical protein
MTQRDPSLLSAIVDPHDIRLQHFIMLRWVLLCDYCSCFYIFQRPLKGYHWNFIRKWLQESNIFKHPLVHPWPRKCISKGHKTIQLVKKSACAKDTKAVHARATVE